MNYNYSIVIVTYDKRYQDNFIPLIEEIKRQAPNIEISLMINGSYNKQFNEEYRKNILKLISGYNNIYPQIYTKFTSLAKLWNRGIQNASNNKVLVLNDDTSIKDGFLNFIDLANINDLTLINGIFSHFIIDKKFLNSINWFDERFLGVGWEDVDIRRKMSNINNLTTDLIISYHNDNYSMQHQNIQYAHGSQGPSKYTKFNEIFFNEKYNNMHKELIQYPYWNFEINRYKDLSS